MHSIEYESAGGRNISDSFGPENIKASTESKLISIILNSLLVFVMSNFTLIDCLKTPKAGKLAAIEMGNVLLNNVISF